MTNVARRQQQSASLRSTVRTAVTVALCLLLMLLRFGVHRMEQYVQYLQEERRQQNAFNATPEDAASETTDPFLVGNNDTAVSSWDNGVRSTTRSRYHSVAHAKDIYWNQVLQSGILDFEYTDSAAASLWSSQNENGWAALRLAAYHGHARAQQLYANALMAGFGTISSTQNPQKNAWRVSDTWWMTDDPARNDDDRVLLQQQAEAMLLWKMAAIGGNVEAMITLGYRIEEQMAPSENKENPSACHMALPYYASAAHVIMDELLHHPLYRGQITPAQDRHVLYKLHVHGSHHGAAVSSEVDNRPDESQEALQFFKIKAAPLLLAPAASKNPARSLDSSVTAAAYTLGRYYHTGARGIAANLSLAVQYYTAAARAGHWEAAGQGGLLLFWNMGGEAAPNESQRYQAYQLFQLGAPFELNGCQLRYQLKVSQSQQQKGANHQEPIYLCDSESLNGLGLIYLFGLPSQNISINLPIATEFFELARDQGNANAAYHLAMMKLGWRTHYSTDPVANQTMKEDSAEKDATLSVLDVDNDNSGMSAARKAQELFPLEPKKKKVRDNQNSLTIAEYKTIVADLTTATKKGHVMARHRLAMLYEMGIQLDKSDAPRMLPKYVLTPDCAVATSHYKWILENASPTLAKRMRRAYQQYMAGNYVDSLRNYLLVSETGHGIAQLNAAFLLEQGVCLGLSSVDCAKASVRLWKAVAKNGNAEASMRVGDFYYYGRFRDAKDRVRGENSIPVGPWGWIDYLIYPEKLFLPLLWNELKRQIINFSVWEPLSILDLPTTKQKQSDSSQRLEREESTCDAEAGSVDGSCPMADREAASSLREPTPENEQDEDLTRRRRQLDDDLAMAAHYYQLAADRTGTARAHFNLGFMYEWGLGLKQDFPLAKRQYDLAVSSLSYSQEADIPVSLALMALNIHEYFVKLKLSWERYWASDSEKDQSSAPVVEL